MISLNENSLKQWQAENLEHLRYEYPDVKPGEFCIDIGSYEKEWANEMIKRYQVEVECFDVRDNRGAWTKDAKIKMGGAYYYTSMYEQGGEWYNLVDIAPFLQKEIAVVKMNIEGMEYDLLQYIIARGLHNNIRNLQVQFHLIEGHPCEEIYKVIADSLSLTHELKWRYPYCWESWQRIGTTVE